MRTTRASQKAPLILIVCDEQTRTAVVRLWNSLEKGEHAFIFDDQHLILIYKIISIELDMLLHSSIKIRILTAAGKNDFTFVCFLYRLSQLILTIPIGITCKLFIPVVLNCSKLYMFFYIFKQNFLTWLFLLPL